MSDWVCPNCTFENPSEFVSCASCSVPRGELEVFDPFDDTHYTPASDDDAASIPPPSPPNQTAERAETAKRSRSNNLQDNPNDRPMTSQFKKSIPNTQVIPGNSKGEGLRNGIENSSSLLALSESGGNEKSAFDASLATVRSSRSNNLQGYNPNDRQMTSQFKESMSLIQVIPGNSKGDAGKGWSNSSSMAPREGMRKGIEKNPLLVALSKFGGDGKSALDASLAQAQIEWEEHDNEDPRQRDERINQLLMNEDKLAKSAKKPTFFTIPPPANVPSGDMASEVARLDTLGRYKDITPQNWNGPLKLGETIRFLSDADSPTQNAYTIRRTGYTSVGLFYVCSCLTWFMDQKSGGVGFRGRIKSCKHICRLRGERAEFDRCRADNPMRSMVNNKTFMPSLPHKVTLEYLNQDDKGEFNDWIVSEKFDGIRCYFDGFNFWTKAGMPIFPPEFFMEGLRTSDGTKFTPLDGELFIGRGDFQELVHLVLRSDMPDWWKNVKYIVFDCPEATGGLELRLGVAREKVKEAKCKYVEVVETEKVSDKEHLLSKLDEVDKLGGEGLCFADPYARYKAGRNKSSRKLKLYEDDEAVIVDYQGGTGQYLGYLGGLVCRGRNGNKFTIGNGFPFYMREPQYAEEHFPLGSFVTFACFGLWYNVRSETVPSIPRLPNFRSKAFEIPNVPLEPNPDAEDEIHERNCLNLLTMNVDVYLQQHGSSRDFVDEEDADNDNTKMGKRKRSN